SYAYNLNPLPFITIAQFTFEHYRHRYLPSRTLYYLDYSYDTFARKALHGGNTNVRRLHYECTPQEAGTIHRGEKVLRYIDIQSLYPTVQFYDAMPVGYPKTVFYSEDSQPSHTELETFFGFIECDIEPTKFLFHPLLARYHNSRLYMDLHPHKRVVLTSVEFQLAISEECQYRCARVYRIDHYKKSTDLFRPFISNWLKLKITSSPRPDESTFSEFANDLKTKLDINVTSDDFQPNPSLRTLAKLVLNSLWGKFGQRSQLPENMVIKSADSLFEYHANVHMGYFNEKATKQVGISSIMKTFTRERKWNKKNVAIAAFVTANARIRLWKILNQLGDRVLYHDTDSVIYERRFANDTMIKEDKYLGDWESETGDALIHEFVGLAPKTYSYAYIDPKSGKRKEVVKSKGFTIKQETTKVLNLKTYREILKSACQSVYPTEGENHSQVVDVPVTVFRHDIDNGIMFTAEQKKQLTFNYQKGFINYSNMKTYPYGSQKFLGNALFAHQKDHVIDTIIEDPCIDSLEDNVVFQCLHDL
ncbi:MAG: hypothetical protein KDD03_11320, partial [Gelidibacter sp.]|nr:hypothetical protein [Gelidibacter sp.]